MIKENKYNSKNKYSNESKKKYVKKRSFKTDKYKSDSKDESVRLNKYIASTGLCSRREADEYIKAGLIKVNNKIITEFGTTVSKIDIIKYKGKILKSQKKVYILLNKPKDFITTVDDPHAKKKVMDLVKNACDERIYPVGRLDRNTTGVLLLTNDGELTKKLTHPSFNKKKIYHVFLNKNLSLNDIEKIREGIELEDGFIKVDSINYVTAEDKKQVGIEIHSGKNHIVKRIFEKFNYDVKRLDRVYFAGLIKKGLPRGKWRFLRDKEIAMLKMGSFK